MIQLTWCLNILVQLLCWHWERVDAIWMGGNAYKTYQPHQKTFKISRLISDQAFHLGRRRGTTVNLDLLKQASILVSLGFQSQQLLTEK